MVVASPWVAPVVPASPRGTGWGGQGQGRTGGLAAETAGAVGRGGRGAGGGAGPHQAVGQVVGRRGAVAGAGRLRGAAAAEAALALRGRRLVVRELGRGEEL